MTSWNNILKPQKGDIRAISPKEGTTVNAYAEAVDLDTRWLEETIITISNTAGTHELTYKVDVYNDYANGIAHTITSNTVAINDSDQVILRRHARVKVSVKSTATNNHTTYQVDVIAGR